MSRQISPESRLKVETWLRGLIPKAASISYIRDRTMVGTKTISVVCEELVAAGRVEVIDTTAGRMYRWKG